MAAKFPTASLLLPRLEFPTAAFGKESVRRIDPETEFLPPVGPTVRKNSSSESVTRRDAILEPSTEQAGSIQTIPCQPVTMVNRVRRIRYLLHRKSNPGLSTYAGKYIPFAYFCRRIARALFLTSLRRGCPM